VLAVVACANVGNVMLARAPNQRTTGSGQECLGSSSAAARKERPGVLRLPAWIVRLRTRLPIRKKLSQVRFRGLPEARGAAVGELEVLFPAAAAGSGELGVLHMRLQQGAAECVSYTVVIAT
jgi:hypothetical protein